MQKIVGDKLRPADKKDPHGVAEAKAQIEFSYGMLDRELAGKRAWAMGEAFTLVDCAACPALYYANRVAPLGDRHPNVTEYLNRLHARPSFARVMAEADPYLPLFPG
jgi:glutathione S-transferase